MQQAGAPGLGQEVSAEANQASGWHAVVEANPAGAVVGHLVHDALTRGDELGDGTHVLFGNVNRHGLDWLMERAIDLAGDDLGLADGELEALAAHLLDQNGELKFATALDFPRIGATQIKYPKRYVADQFLVQTILDLTSSHLVAAAAGEWRGVAAHGHRQAGLVDGDDWQRPRVGRVAQRFADGDLGKTRDCDELARGRAIGFFAFVTLGHVQLGDLAGGDRAIELAPGHVLALLDLAIHDPADGETADVGRSVEVGDPCLQGCIGVVARWRDVLGDRFEQRRKVVAQVVEIQRGLAVAGNGVHDGEVDLVFVGIDIEEQVLDFSYDLGHAGIGPIDLVDDQDNWQVALQRLAEHEPSLGEWTFAGIDQQENAVDHGEGSFDLATKVGVTWCVDHVDLDAVPSDGGVLRQDGDAFFLLEVHRVHDAFVNGLMGAEGTRLMQHAIDQRGLAMINVSNNCHVSNICPLCGTGDRGGIHRSRMAVPSRFTSFRGPFGHMSRART